MSYPVFIGTFYFLGNLLLLLQLFNFGLFAYAVVSYKIKDKTLDISDSWVPLSSMFFGQFWLIALLFWMLDRKMSFSDFYFDLKGMSTQEYFWINVINAIIWVIAIVILSALAVVVVAVAPLLLALLIKSLPFLLIIAFMVGSVYLARYIVKLKQKIYELSWQAARYKVEAEAAKTELDALIAPKPKTRKATVSRNKAVKAT